MRILEQPDPPEEHILAFARESLGSVWAVELLILMRGQAAAGWTLAKLVRESRSSGDVVSAALDMLRSAKLVERQADDRYRYAPASPNLDALAAAVQKMYAAKPVALIKGMMDTPVDKLSQNYLVISTEPVEGIELQFNTKVPGPSINIDGVEMKFRYKDYFNAEPSTGYETLIYDCMIGDNILFQRADSVEAGWQAVQPFLDAWKKAGPRGLKIYDAGTEGPEYTRMAASGRFQIQSATPATIGGMADSLAEVSRRSA